MNFIVHLSGDIGTKHKNRRFFEKVLVRNIRAKCPNVGIKGGYGRLVVEGEGNLCDVLSRTSGIANFSECFSASLDFDEIKNVVLSLALKSSFSSFKIDTRRINKRFEYNSREINEMLGEVVKKKTGARVCLEAPEKTFFVEICEKNAYVYCDKKMGVGGLPVGTSSKLVSLLSGGIDSPVASIKMMLRGCAVVHAHFHNYATNEEALEKKMGKLLSVLSWYQPSTKAYILPFRKAQKEIIRVVPARYRMLVYRRAMLRLAENVRRKERARGFITGDSLGQVASQTMENLEIVWSAAKVPIYAPLIGMGKEEIVDLAMDFGTYETSIIEYQDCCSFLIAEHPVTKGRKAVVDMLERNIDWDVVMECMDEAVVIKDEDLRLFNAKA